MSRTSKQLIRFGELPTFRYLQGFLNGRAQDCWEIVSVVLDPIAKEYLVVMRK